MNIGILSGRLGADAELRAMPNGDPVANFSLAVDTGSRDKPETMWVRCSVFGRRAESLTQYLTKGTKVTVEGKIRLDSYQDKQGQDRQGLRLSVQELDLHLPPRGGDDLGHEVAGMRAKALRTETVRGPVQQDLNDDIPF